MMVKSNSGIIKPTESADADDIRVAQQGFVNHITFILNLSY